MLRIATATAAKTNLQQRFNTSLENVVKEHHLRFALPSNFEIPNNIRHSILSMPHLAMFVLLYANAENSRSMAMDKKVVEKNPFGFQLDDFDETHQTMKDGQAIVQGTKALMMRLIMSELNRLCMSRRIEEKSTFGELADPETIVDIARKSPVRMSPECGKHMNWTIDWMMSATMAEASRLVANYIFEHVALLDLQGYIQILRELVAKTNIYDGAQIH